MAQPSSLRPPANRCAVLIFIPLTRLWSAIHGCELLGVDRLSCLLRQPLQQIPRATDTLLRQRGTPWPLNSAKSVTSPTANAQRTDSELRILLGSSFPLSQFTDQYRSGPNSQDTLDRLGWVVNAVNHASRCLVFVSSRVERSRMHMITQRSFRTRLSGSLRRRAPAISHPGLDKSLLQFMCSTCIRRVAPLILSSLGCSMPPGES